MTTLPEVLACHIRIHPSDPARAPLDDGADRKAGADDTGGMVGSPGGASRRVVGRDEERTLLLDAVRGAVEGWPCAVFVHGEAGAGKTSLVREVGDITASDGVAVLWGRCVRFGAVESTYLPLVMAIEGWLDSADVAERARILEGLTGAPQVLPSLGGDGGADPVRLLPIVESLLMRIASEHPTLLVVDDVQWADPASWDTLAHLIAGFRGQRIAIVTTYRDEELVAGHPLLGWLADMRRLPGVRAVRIPRLSLEETEEQLAMLLAGDPHPGLVVDVMARTGGNPYLSELLVDGLTVESERLPDGLPGALTDALLAAWHRLSPQAREVSQVLAVSGSPASVADLASVAAAAGLSDDLTRALAEAIGNGILVAQGDTVWFRHPLLAETLLTTLVPGQEIPVHAAWAESLGRSVAFGVEEVRRLGALALHHEAAHNLPAAMHASMLAADLAHDLRVPREEALHLRRAVRLWPQASVEDTERNDEVVLLDRAARCSALVGDDEQAERAWGRALDLLDAEADPLRYSHILIEQSQVLWQMGRTAEEPLAEARRAVELSQRHPDSPEHAEALANLSDCLSWSGEYTEASTVAEHALVAAQRSGSHNAISFAYGARAEADMSSERVDEDTREAVRHARLTGDPTLLLEAYVVRSNYFWSRGMLEGGAAVAAQALQAALSDGVTSRAAFLAGLWAGYLLELGQLNEAHTAIREGLALKAVYGSANLRLVATVHAVRRGDLAAARQHAARARELIPSLEERPGLVAPPRLAELLLAQRRPDQALAMLKRTMPAHSVDPRVTDMMLKWGARAAADQAEHARDLRDTGLELDARRALEELIALRAALPGRPFATISEDDPELPATRALFEAESGRCAGAPGASQLWNEARDACARAKMVWEQHLSALSLAAALVAEGAPKPRIATPLRAAYIYACGNGAEPLRQRTEELARLSRIPLDTAVPVPAPATPLPFLELTQREREVLAHLVAGRTYAEIAQALFISEKTVSAHVSNVLRKTGTASRQEVSTLAVRLLDWNPSH